MKPVVYLDVDDTLLRFPPVPAKKLVHRLKKGELFEGLPAPGVQDFLFWLKENAEVRWLTMWAMRGTMHPELEEKLARLLDVPQDLIAGWHNPLDWGGTPGGLKTSGINWDEHEAGRPWIWLEDGILLDEREILKEKKVFSRWIECNVSRNPQALTNVWQRLKTRKEWEGWWK